MSNAARNSDGPIIVRKYGGSSLADIPRLREVARDLAAVRAQGQRLVVVVSAMGDHTDELVRLAHEANPAPPRRELDMLLTVGERVSMSLLCMALAAEGVPAISLTGSQVGIITDASHTDARIREVRAYRIGEALAAGQVVVVAGFQGYCDQTREITTLGRGGSDTTAVALAHALGAERCEILKDVPGVMTADPRLVPEASRIERLTYDELLAIADSGCGVVHPRAVAYAASHQVPLFVGSSFVPGPGTLITPEPQPAAPPTSRLHAIAITVADRQGRLVLTTPTGTRRDLPNAANPAVEWARLAAARGALTAEWQETDRDWCWEGWATVTALAPVAEQALARAADPTAGFTARWQTDRTAIAIAVRRPESWCGALQELAGVLATHGHPDAVVRTDGQVVRVLVPAASAPGLLPALHGLVGPA